MGQILIVVAGLGLGGCFISYGAGWVRHGLPLSETRTIHGPVAKAAGVGQMVFGLLVIVAAVGFLFWRP